MSTGDTQYDLEQLNGGAKIMTIDANDLFVLVCAIILVYRAMRYVWKRINLWRLRRKYEAEQLEVKKL